MRGTWPDEEKEDVKENAIIAILLRNSRVSSLPVISRCRQHANSMPSASNQCEEARCANRRIGLL